MALTRCPQCSEELSDKVTTCPNCGYSLREHATEAVPTRPAQEGSAVIPKPEAAGKATEASVPAGIEERFRQVHAEQGPIQAIKYWRQVTGASLAQAKAFYDQEKAAGRLGEPQPRSKGSGCLVALAVAAFVVALAVAIGAINYSCSQNGGHSSRDPQQQIRGVAHHRPLTSGPRVAAC
jgi:hypothetical protein